MQSWRFVLAGSVCTVLACIPHTFEAEQAAMPVFEATPAMATLKLQNVAATSPFTSRSPISAFSSSSNRPLSGLKICVDPGHGGQYLTKTHYTGGTVGVATGQTESDVNLRVSLILREYLKAAGAQVIMTRTTDERCQGDTCKRAELDFRTDIANSANADLFISVHHNEGTNRSTNYTAVFHPKGVSSSISLAENISSAVSKYIGTTNVGAKIGDYRVLDRARMPGVIVEASFMSNPTEDQRLAQLSYNKMEAKAIATGILNYVRLSKGRQVDFNTIFSPIDEQAGSAQMMADASFVRKQIVESRSLFGSRYEEVTYDPAGNVVSRREVGNSSLQAKRSVASSRNTVKATAAKVTAAAKTTVSKSASVTKKVVATASKSAKSEDTAKKVTITSSAKSESIAKKGSTSETSSKSASKSAPETASAKKSIPQVSKPVVSSSSSSAKKSVSVADAKSSPKSSTEKSKKAVN